MAKPNSALLAAEHKIEAEGWLAQHQIIVKNLKELRDRLWREISQTLKLSAHYREVADEIRAAASSIGRA